LRHSDKSPRGRRIFTSLERITAFSDGVFAVAITLLVLSIAVPAFKGAHTNTNLWRSLSSVWGLFFAYVLSFLIIGTFWYRHHDLFDRLEKADSVMVYLCTLLLMVIAFIPYATSLLGRYGDSKPPSIISRLQRQYFTGKTFTALGCAQAVSSQPGINVLIITCPFQHLIQQWRRELDKFGINGF
jgi:uncharacterized membrane protein